MFSPTPLQKLYPHLSFARVEPPSRSTSQPPKTPINIPRVEEKPKVIEKVVEKPAPVEIKPEPVKEIEKSSKVSKKVKVVEKEQPKVEIKPEPVKVEEKPKPKVSRPNRRPEPKPEPKRETQIPKKGEKGLQPQYTIEQKREMFLERLSRKSVKRAEQEVSKINEVLTAVDYDPKRLKEEEHKVKAKLKLINNAKYFTSNNSIKDAISENTQKVAPKSENVVRYESKSRHPVEDRGRRGRRTSVASSSGGSTIRSSSVYSGGTRSVSTSSSAISR